MEYFEIRHAKPESLVQKSSIQWFGNHFPGEEAQIIRALETVFDISVLAKSPPNNSVYEATYRAIEKNGVSEFTIAAQWFDDFNGFILSIEDKALNDEKFDILVRTLTNSGHFVETTMEQYSAKHPEW